MFNAKEIDFMKKIGLNFDFSSLSDDEFIEVESTVGDYYTKKAQSTSKVTAEILMCEAILGKL